MLLSTVIVLKLSLFFIDFGGSFQGIIFKRFRKGQDFKISFVLDWVLYFLLKDDLRTRQSRLPLLPFVI